MSYVTDRRIDGSQMPLVLTARSLRHTESVLSLRGPEKRGHKHRGIQQTVTKENGLDIQFGCVSHCLV